MHLVFVRGLSYVFTLLVLTCIYLLFASALLYVLTYLYPNEAISPLGVSALAPALLVAMLFPPVKRFMNRLSDKMLYKDNYTVTEFVAEMSQVLNSTSDLRTLL